MAKGNDPDGYPEPTLSDYAIEMAKGAAGLVPGGSVVAPLFKTSLDRKKEAFLRSLSHRVKAVEEFDHRCLLARAADGDEDAQDEVVSIQSKINRLVEEANTEAKREMLAAALVSSFTWPADDEEMERHLFLRCLSDFEPIHIELLSRAREGLVPVREIVGEGNVRGEIAQSAWAELFQRNMVSVESTGGVMTGSGMSADRTTARGMRFLRFVGWRPDDP